MDGAQDLQVMDDALWGQVVPQRGPHHRIRHVLNTDGKRVSSWAPAGPRHGYGPQFWVQGLFKAYPHKYENLDNFFPV